MTNRTIQMAFRQALGMVCILLLPVGALLVAQEPPPPAEQAPPAQAGPPAQALSTDQLADLVAPIALYPDSLLSQVLVAATYPLEVVEAGQWLQQNRNLRGPQLVEAARQQNWDASVQALVVFPDVLNRLNSGYSLDHRSRERISGSTGRRHGCCAAACEPRPARRADCSPTPRRRSPPRRKADQSAIAIQPRTPRWCTCRFTIRNTFGDRPSMATILRCFIQDVGVGYSFGAGILHRRQLQRPGLGRAGDGDRDGSTTTSVINSNFSHRYGFHDFQVAANSKAGRTGRTIPVTGWACLIPIREMNNRFRGGDFARGGGSPAVGNVSAAGTCLTAARRKAEKGRSQERAAPRAGGSGALASSGEISGAATVRSEVPAARPPAFKTTMASPASGRVEWRRRSSAVDADRRRAGAASAVDAARRRKAIGVAMRLLPFRARSPNCRLPATLLAQGHAKSWIRPEAAAQALMDAAAKDDTAKLAAIIRPTRQGDSHLRRHRAGQDRARRICPHRSR